MQPGRQSLLDAALCFGGERGDPAAGAVHVHRDRAGPRATEPFGWFGLPTRTVAPRRRETLTLAAWVDGDLSASNVSVPLARSALPICHPSPSGHPEARSVWACWLAFSCFLPPSLPPVNARGLAWLASRSPLRRVHVCTFCTQYGAADDGISKQRYRPPHIRTAMGACTRDGDAGADADADADAGVRIHTGHRSVGRLASGVSCLGRRGRVGRVGRLGHLRLLSTCLGRQSSEGARPAASRASDAPDRMAAFPEGPGFAVHVSSCPPRPASGPGPAPSLSPALKIRRQPQTASRGPASERSQLYWGRAEAGGRSDGEGRASSCGRGQN
jgi:hypothetical protein